MSEGVVLQSPFYPSWHPIGGGVEVLIDGSDPMGVMHVRRGDVEERIIFTPAGYWDWTPITDDIEVKTPMAAVAGTIHIRHRARRTHLPLRDKDIAGRADQAKHVGAGGVGGE